MLIVGLVLCLVIWYVMQGGNTACGKTVGTLMGIGVLLLPFILIGIVIAIFVIPMLLVALPVRAFFGAIIWIFGSIMWGGKPSKGGTGRGDGSGVVRYATRAEFEAAQAAKW